MDEEVEEVLWYFCMTCNRGYKDELKLTDHKESSHGISRKSKLAFILSEQDLSPDVVLQKCEDDVISKYSRVRRTTDKNSTEDVLGCLVNMKIDPGNSESFLEDERSEEDDDYLSMDSNDNEYITAEEFRKKGVSNKKIAATRPNVKKNTMSTSNRSIHDLTCKYCGKMFTRTYGLKRHLVRYHSGAGPNDIGKPINVQKANDRSAGAVQQNSEALKDKKCEFCGKGFKRSYDLKEHRRIHTNERPYKCQICGMGFRKTNALKGHQLLHLKPPEVQAKLLSRIPKLRRERERNLGTRPGRLFMNKAFKCPATDCNRVFGLYENLYHHVKRLHINFTNLRCSVCEIRTLSLKEFQEHQRIHKTEAAAGKAANDTATATTSIPDSEQKGYKCDHCGENFHLLAHLSNHISISHTITNLYCSVCGIRTLSAKEFQEHQSIHKTEATEAGGKAATDIAPPAPSASSVPDSEQNDYICEHCGASFQLQAHLSNHISINHMSTEICTICNKTYSHPLLLECHLQWHRIPKKEGLWQCDTCGIEFHTYSRFNYHNYNTHNPTNPVFQCLLCGFMYHRLETLEKHETEIHTEEELSIGRSSVMYRETGKGTPTNGPLKCITCNKSFPTSGRLNFHIQICHLKLYKCHLCPKSFCLKSQLVEHLNFVHDEEVLKTSSTGDPVERLTENLCSFCGKSFTTTHGLNQHMKVHYDKDRFSCPTCDQKFSKRSNMKKHQKIKTCPLCEQMLCGKVEDNGHIEPNLEKPHICCQCGKGFKICSSLTYHLKHHLIPEGSKLEPAPRFQCNLCTYRCRFQPRFDAHMKEHEKKFYCKQCKGMFDKFEIKAHREQCKYETIGIPKLSMKGEAMETLNFSSQTQVTVSTPNLSSVGILYNN